MRLFPVLVLSIALVGCATPGELRERGPQWSVVTEWSVERVRDCIQDHLGFGGLYGLSLQPYGDGYRLRNTSGQLYGFEEVMPGDEGGAVISGYGMSRAPTDAGGPLGVCVQRSQGRFITS